MQPFNSLPSSWQRAFHLKAVLWAAIFVDARPAFAGLFQSRSQGQA